MEAGDIEINVALNVYRSLGYVTYFVMQYTERIHYGLFHIRSVLFNHVNVLCIK